MDKVDTNIINGQGLDILKEFGIHVIDKESNHQYSELVSATVKSLPGPKKDLKDLLPCEEISHHSGPVEDLIDLLKKWEGKHGSFNNFKLLIFSLTIGYIKNPAFLQLSLLDMSKRMFQISEQDPLFSIMKEDLAAKRITVSSHIRQDVFVQLAKIASKQRISISKLISNLLETDLELNKESCHGETQPKKNSR